PSPVWRGCLASAVEVGVGLLGYGTVGSSVNRLLVDSADEIERATCHRLRVVRALVRDHAKERPFSPDDGVLTTEFAALRDDPRGLAIVSGTTKFILKQMGRGGSYAEALAEAQQLGYAEADPTDDVSGADAAAKMAILATVAFGSRVQFDDVERQGIEELEPA